MMALCITLKIDNNLAVLRVHAGVKQHNQLAPVACLSILVKPLLKV